MNKYLITIEVPTLEFEYDLYIPNNKKIGTIKKYILESIKSLTNNSFNQEFNEVRIIDKDTGSEFDNDMYVKDSGIKNGGAYMNINIDFQATRNLGEEIKEKAGEFQTVLNNIINSNEQLKSAWEGTDANFYTKEVEEQAKIMQELYKTINKMGEFLVEVGNAYENVSKSNAGM